MLTAWRMGWSEAILERISLGQITQFCSTTLQLPSRKHLAACDGLNIVYVYVQVKLIRFFACKDYGNLSGFMFKNKMGENVIKKWVMQTPLQ